MSHLEPGETCLLFSYFIGHGDDGLHLAWSADGYRWHPLNGGASYLRPVLGQEKLMRDPSLVRGPGGTFHLLFTSDWNGEIIGHASSRDLLEWSEQRALRVMGDLPVRNCWAPEAVHDRETGEFLLVWSSTVDGMFPETTGQSENDYNHRLFCCTTRDFVTLSEPRVFFEPGHVVIDGSIFESDGVYYLAYKDETFLPEARKHLRIARAEKVHGPYTLVGEAISRGWIEGPSICKVGGEFLLYGDAYRAQHYCAFRSTDLQNWQDVTEQVEFPPGIQHGLVLEVPGEIVRNLIARGPGA